MMTTGESSRGPRRFTLLLKTIALLVAGLCLCGAGERAVAQPAGRDLHPLRPAETTSPRGTLESFLENARAAIRLYQVQDLGADFERARDRALRTLDLSQLPPAIREEQGIERLLLLLEILQRVDLPPLDEIPDAAKVAAKPVKRWTIPDTEISIALTESGPHAGEYQFSAQTVALLPTFYARSRHLSYKPGAIEGIYEKLAKSPGPLLPIEWTQRLPSSAHALIMGQPLWQWAGALATVALVFAIAVMAYLAGRRADQARSRPGTHRYLGRMIATAIIPPLIVLGIHFISDGVRLGGAPAAFFRVALQSVFAIAVAWLFALMLTALGETVIQYRASRAKTVNVQLIRVVMRVLAIVVLAYVTFSLAESFGVPAAPLIASLGVGGLAVALAVRPTLENIVGGFILFADKPVKVGEFCLFGDKMGTVEQIGLRSTRIRGVDRTVITVPNADFAQMQIINFTRRDQMLLKTMLCLRQETTPDQLRYVLTKLREVFVAHPKLSPDPARARYVGFGDFSLNIEIFVYVRSSDYDEYLAIAEDIYLRIMEIIAEAGTALAFPSQTAYIARDRGMHAERGEAAAAEVQAWRESGALPFPGLDPRRVAELDATLDYPPKGSVNYQAEAWHVAAGDSSHRRQRDQGLLARIRRRGLTPSS